MATSRSIINFVLLYIILFLHRVVSISCPQGTFWSSNTSLCSPCLPGTFQSQQNATACHPCEAGKYFPFLGAQTEAACRHCPKGTYSTTGATVCTPCPEGKSSLTGSAECINCPKGSYMAGRGIHERVSCRLCDRGGYSDEENLPFCKRCPLGSSAPIGATSIEQCSTCPAGTYSQGFACQQCPPSTFSHSGSSECELCPDGSASSEFPYGSTKCIPCQTGKYGRTQRIMYGVQARCLDCPENTTSYSPGASICRRINGPCPRTFLQTSSGDCVKCKVDERYNVLREHCTKCEPGSGSVGGLPLLCAPCSEIVKAGIHQSRCFHHNVVPFDEQGDCPPGTQISRESNSVCVSCLPGEFSALKNSARCERCPSGTIASTIGANQCSLCPAGSLANEDRTECVVAQTGCPIGMHLKIVDGISRCKRDICSLTNKTSSLSPICDSCYIGSLHNSTLCPSCPGNEVRFQTNGGYDCGCLGHLSQNVGIIDGVCSVCPSGSFGRPAQAGSNNVCVKCPAGTYRVQSSAEKLISSFCPRCRIPDPCERCPVGFVTRYDGATECEQCPEGTYTYGIGDSECLLLGSESTTVSFNSPSDKNFSSKLSRHAYFGF